MENSKIIEVKADPFPYPDDWSQDDIDRYHMAITRVYGGTGTSMPVNMPNLDRQKTNAEILQDIRDYLEIRCAQTGWQTYGSR